MRCDSLSSLPISSDLLWPQLQYLGMCGLSCLGYSASPSNLVSVEKPPLARLQVPCCVLVIILGGVSLCSLLGCGLGGSK